LPLTNQVESKRKNNKKHLRLPIFKQASMDIKFIVMTILLFIMVPKAQAQTGCSNCDSVLTGNITAINVPAGKTWCLQSANNTVGAGSFSIASGAILCISQGASLKVTSWWTNASSGKIINQGNLQLSGGGLYGPLDIDNYGNLIQSDNGIQNFSGTFNNYGTGTFGGTFQVKDGTINNTNNLIFNGNVDITGTLENTGHVYFAGGISSGAGLSGTVNNYGLFESSGVVNFTAGTYLTNDSTMNFKNGNVQFQGALYTNNGRIAVTNDFALNSITNGVYNNGIFVVGGSITFGASVKIVNNCRIVSVGNLKIDKDSIINNGLLWVTGANSKISTTTGAYIKSGHYGFIRGVNFENGNGANISGLGSFYFTGTSSNGGVINGDSVSNKLKFYNPTGNTINVSGGTSNSNVGYFTTDSITPLDTTAFDCSVIPPQAAGNPPTVKDTTINLCTSSIVTLNMATNGMVVPYTGYSILWNTLKLFSNGGNENVTTLTLANKGTFTFTTNGAQQNIKFVPLPTFKSGTAIVQYKVADKKNPITGTGTTDMSIRKTITIKFDTPPAPTEIIGGGF